MFKLFSIVISVLLVSLLLSVSAFAMSDEDFIQLCKKGTLEEVKKAIANGANVNAKDIDDRTALMRAVYSNPSPDVIAELIKAGADVNAKDINDNTVLSHAVDNSNPEVIKELIKAGSNINAKSVHGCTA
ncbi:Ankyrin repeat-containing protein, partial [Desulfovibrio litoralis DSM 11393]